MRTNVLLILLIVGIVSCKPKLNTYSAEVNLVNKETTGSVILKSLGYGNTRETAIDNAQTNAFNVLIFRGIPGTDLNMPLVENEKSVRVKHKAYFDKFFNENYYKTFMMSSTESSNLINKNGIKNIYVDVKININSLRKDLEQNNIIRKFGY